LNRVIITGGTGAIGEALVREFSRDCEVLFTYLTNNEKAARVADKYQATGIRCDCRDSTDVNRVVADFGRCDLLVNNAGISQYKLLQDITDDDFASMLAVNLSGAFFFSRAVWPGMLSRKSGVILNISSRWGIEGAAMECHYSAAKAGLIGLTKSLALEGAPSGIRVNCIAPGAVKSRMTEQFSDEELAELSLTGRVGKPSDIAETARFLFNAVYITGEVLPIIC
jgi:3-oxoacyl-[acyl-carrier protein] reductase